VICVDMPSIPHFEAFDFIGNTMRLINFVYVVSILLCLRFYMTWSFDSTESGFYNLLCILL